MKLKEFLTEATEKSVEDILKVYAVPLINKRGNIDIRDKKLTTLKGCPPNAPGDFDCALNHLDDLQGGPDTVGGSFYCNGNKLTTLEGGPKTVGISYFCSGNALTTLKGAPDEISGDFYADDNKLTSLEGIPRKAKGIYVYENKLTTLKDVHKLFDYIDGPFNVYLNPIKSHVLGLLLIKGVTKINFGDAQIENILNKYLGKGRVGMLQAQEELIEAGLEEFAQL